LVAWSFLQQVSRNGDGTDMRGDTIINIIIALIEVIPTSVLLSLFILAGTTIAISMDIFTGPTDQFSSL
jgi:hypothetical protein